MNVRASKKTENNSDYKLVPVLTKPVKAINDCIYKTNVKGLYICKKGCAYRKIEGLNQPYYVPLQIVQDIDGPAASYNNMLYSLKKLVIDTFIDTTTIKNSHITKYNDHPDNNSLSNFRLKLYKKDSDKYYQKLFTVLDDRLSSSSELSVEIKQPNSLPHKDILEESASQKNVIFFNEETGKYNVVVDVFVRNLITDDVYYFKYLRTLQKYVSYNTITLERVEQLKQSNGIYKDYDFSSTSTGFKTKNPVYTTALKNKNLIFGTMLYIISKDVSRIVTEDELWSATGKKISNIKAYVDTGKLYNGYIIKSIKKFL